ncbi:MAG: OstA family protein [Anaerosporomusa subterranea]|jgi:lipopolysaccharide export system protein LptA|nr:OstA family protein [Anaerosporomusa subterranea]
MNKRVAMLTLLLLLVLSNVVFAAMPIIKADTTYFDPGDGVYVLKGNVLIEAGKRTFTASQAKVSLGSFEVWGTGGVTVAEGDIFFTGDSVYVYGKDHMAKIDGGLRFSRSNIDIVADHAEYNWKTKLAVFTGNVAITRDGATTKADTASYSFKTNQLL